MSACDWFMKNEERKAYHEEWGTPVHDDRKQFEILSLEVMQCGLNFGLILQQRPLLRRCFEEFDVEKVAQYGASYEKRILETPGMIRSGRKIRAIIQNARALQKVREEEGSFSAYLWSFTQGKSLIYPDHAIQTPPTSNALSVRICKDLKKRGFCFIGPVVIYSHLEACGVINDHGAECPRRQWLLDHYPTICGKE